MQSICTCTALYFPWPDAARKIRLLDSGIEIARLDNQPEQAAAKLIAKLRIEVIAEALFDRLRSLQIEWYERVRDGGPNFASTVANHPAQASVQIASGTDQQGAALNDLGNALKTLGERESGTDRLEQTVAAYNAALQERTQDRAPLQLAITQSNLGGIEVDFSVKPAMSRIWIWPRHMPKPRERS